MKNALLAILLCGVAVVACNSERDAVEDKPTPQISVADTASLPAASSDDAGIDIRADMESGEVALKLPGGLEGKVKIPKGLESESQFDLDGVGRYPGSKLVSVNVTGTAGDGGGSGRVVLGFSAPGTAGQVADWYQKALIDRNRAAVRTGNSISSTTKDGDRMVIAVEDGAGGVARGRITITDTTRG